MELYRPWLNILRSCPESQVLCPFTGHSQAKEWGQSCNMHRSFPCKEKHQACICTYKVAIVAQWTLLVCHTNCKHLPALKKKKKSNMLPSPTRGSNELLSPFFAATELLMFAKLKGCEQLQLFTKSFPTVTSAIFFLAAVSALPLQRSPPWLYDLQDCGLKDCVCYCSDHSGPRGK